MCVKEGPGHLSRCGASDAERMAERLGGEKERLAFPDCQYLWVIAERLAPVWSFISFCCVCA